MTSEKISNIFVDERANNLEMQLLTQSFEDWRIQKSFDYVPFRV